MKVRKNLKFPVLALPGVGRILGAGDYEHEEARLFNVGLHGPVADL